MPCIPKKNLINTYYATCQNNIFVCDWQDIEEYGNVHEHSPNYDEVV